MAVDFSGMDRAIASFFGGQVQAIASKLANNTPEGLKASQLEPVFSEDGTSAVITWDSPDALTIHEGSTRVDGTVTPPYRWTQQVITYG